MTNLTISPAGLQDVVLSCSKSQKIEAIKEMRVAVPLSLKAAKDVIDWAYDHHCEQSWDYRVRAALNYYAIDVTDGVPFVDTTSITALLTALLETQRETNELLKDLIDALED